MVEESLMLYLRMFRADIPEGQVDSFDVLKARLAERYQPVLRPAIDAVGKILGVSPTTLRRSSGHRESLEFRRALDGEVYADGDNLVIASLNEDPRRARNRSRETRQGESSGRAISLNLSGFGPTLEPESLMFAVASADNLFGSKLAP